MTDSTARRPRNPVLILSLLLAVFAAPFVLSWWMYNYTQLGRDGGAYSHGDLIQPPRVVPDQALKDPLAPSRSPRLYGKWTLVYLARGECASRCEKRLYMMRQIWLAMGRDSQRLQRVLMLIDPARTPITGWPEYQGQLVTLLNGAAADAVTGIFTLKNGDHPLTADRLYIVDPLGNLMMSYPSGTDPLGIIKDLQRLFKYSGIG